MSDEFNNENPVTEENKDANPETKEKKKLSKGFIIFLIVAGVSLLIGIINGIVQANKTKSVFSIGEKYIAELHIEGVIEDANSTYNQEWLLSTIEELKDDSKNVGMLLYIDSPGGGVYQADEVYLALLDYKYEKPLWAYMGSMAASGGYYIACSANNVIANRNTLTGSIGVIAGQSVDLTDLMEKYGIKMTTITSGKNKNMMNINSPFTEEQKSIMQSIADECYDQFTEIVAEGRDLPIETVKSLADGRIYTAKQALNNGLIDEIASLEDAKDLMLDEVYEDSSKISFKEYKYEFDDGFYSFLMNMKGKIQSPESKLLEELLSRKAFFPAYIYQN